MNSKKPTFDTADFAYALSKWQIDSDAKELCRAKSLMDHYFNACMQELYKDEFKKNTPRR
jgi:hypothetical protein